MYSLLYKWDFNACLSERKNSYCNIGLTIKASV